MHCLQLRFKWHEDMEIIDIGGLAYLVDRRAGTVSNFEALCDKVDLEEYVKRNQEVSKK